MGIWGKKIFRQKEQWMQMSLFMIFFFFNWAAWKVGVAINHIANTETVVKGGQEFCF